MNILLATRVSEKGLYMCRSHNLWGVQRGGGGAGSTGMC